MTTANVGDWLIAIDPLVKEVKVLIHVTVPGFDYEYPSQFTKFILPNPSTALQYYNPAMPLTEYVYDTDTGILMPKPHFELTLDKDSCPGNNADYYTVSIRLVNHLGDELPWDKVSIKDLDQKVQVNKDVLAYGEDNSTFKVRAAQRCTGRIRVKEKPDVSPLDAKGDAYYQYTRAILTLDFYNAGF